MTELVDLELSPEAFGLAPGWATVVEHLGRHALRLEDAAQNSSVPGVELLDGVVELELAVSRERSFPGVNWRMASADFESFFVRPHQIGNPDAIQYTPCPNGISSWQLYHGPGYWAPITFPVDAWFTIRVAFAGTRADIFVDDLTAPVLAIDELGLAPRAGGVGLQVGPGVHVARLSYSPGAPTLIGVPVPVPPRHPGVIASWEVSDAFPERLVTGLTMLPASLLGDRRWSRLDAERTGLANLGRVQGLDADRDTAFARAVIDSPSAVLRTLELGFSDRATLFLNGQALFRGEDTYRSRDYRFLGSIGWWDAVYLPLKAGRNELVIAVSETFGGWGVQARLVED